MRFAIAVGANLGERVATIDRAAALVAASGDIAVVARSALIETAAVGGPPGQGSYLNGVWIVDTGLGPHQLLHRLQAIESALGRVRTVRDGARTIDLDLVLAEPSLVITSAVLTLPHPRLHQRRFVLAPLATVAAHWRHPLLDKTVAELAALVASHSTPPA